MSDHEGTSVDVVRGEMQPWTDYGESGGPAGGPVLRTLLGDVAPQSAGRTLVAGPHGADVIEAVAARSGQVTVLVRSVGDASDLGGRLPGRDVQVLAGALDGLADQVSDGQTAPFDLVVAADGLDRVLGTDSAELDWSQRLDRLARVAAPGARVVVGLSNEFALTALLDRRPADQRHGDEEWRPIHDDPSRPVSMTRLTGALDRAGFEAVRGYAAYSVGPAARTLVDAELVATTEPGHLPARAAVQALEAAATATPLLTPISDAADAAARAGLLGAMASGWLAVCTRSGPPADQTAAGPASGTEAGTAPGVVGQALYTQPAGHDTVVSADLTESGWQLTVRPGPAVADSPGSARFSPELIPAAVPDEASVERRLVRLAAAEDVPGFRALAARLGDWARADAAQVVVHWDDLVPASDGFAHGIEAWAVTGPEGAPVSLAAAWWRFHDRLTGGHRRHPWPPWMVGEPLVTAWLEMSGVQPTAEILKRGRELADELTQAIGIRPDASVTPDVRTALADAERARTAAFELAGQIAALERVLGFRDKQLQVRAERIRSMRSQLKKLTKERTAVRQSRSYKAARQLRRGTVVFRPRRLARAVKRRVGRRLAKARG